MTFLEKARAIQGDYSQTPQYREEKAKQFSVQCWSEILAIVEAAELATYRWDEANHEIGQASADERICEALEALDKKAEEP